VAAFLGATLYGMYHFWKVSDKNEDFSFRRVFDLFDPFF